MGKRLNYSEAIKESSQELETMLKQQSLSINRDRVRFLLSLKTGLAKSQKEAGENLQLCERQSQRIWSMYVKEGIKGMLAAKEETRGKKCKLEKEELAILQEELAKDNIQFLHEAAAYIKEKFGKTYTEQGVHFLFKRLKIKKKTGRPCNIRQDKVGMDNFKKTLKI